MKFIGLSCLLTAFTLAGFRVSSALTQKAVRIRLLRQLVITAETELQSKLPLVPDLLRSLAGQAVFKDLGFLQAAARQADSFPESWDAAVNQDPDLSETEKSVLSNIGQILGATTLDGQLAAFALFQEQLSEMQKEAESAAARRGKLYCSLGLLTGCFCAVLLL